MTAWRRIWILLPLLALAGCQSEPTNFHALKVTAPAAPGVEAPGQLAVGLEPVIMPAAFDRREIVFQEEGTRVDLTATDAWIEPLDTMMTTVVGEDLAGHLGVDQVFYLPTRRGIELDRIVEVEIVGLEADPAGSVVLTAIWRIFDDREELLRSGRTIADESFPPGESVGPMVAAINGAVATLSLELAEALRET